MTELVAQPQSELVLFDQRDGRLVPTGSAFRVAVAVPESLEAPRDRFLQRRFLASLRQSIPHA